VIRLAGALVESHPSTLLQLFTSISSFFEFLLELTAYHRLDLAEHMLDAWTKLQTEVTAQQQEQQFVALFGAAFEVIFRQCRVPINYGGSFAFSSFLSFLFFPLLSLSSFFK
jgi:hypothetical protein